MRLKKKGVVEIQFNWIYVSIVGAIILLVFFSIASGIKKGSERQMEYEALKYFDELFVLMQGSEHTESSISLSGMEIEFDTAKTGEDQCNYYRISDSEEDMKNVPVFSPDIIKKEMYSYSLGWDIPFRANYFLFLTSSEVAYVFSGGEAEKIFNDFPKNITKKKSSVSSFQNQNYYKVRYILTETPSSVSSSVEKIKDKDVTAVRIIPSTLSDVYARGIVEFYEKKGSNFIMKGTSFYIDKATLFAALYSESKEAYECNMNQKAIPRLNEITKLLKKRVEVIKSSDLRPICSLAIYTNAGSLLSETEQITKSSDSLQSKSIRLYEIKKELQAINTELNKKSCPTIY